METDSHANKQSLIEMKNSFDRSENLIESEQKIVLLQDENKKLEK